MVELKDCQQQEMEGKPAISVTSDVIEYVKVRFIFESSQHEEGSYVGDLLDGITRHNGFPPCLQS